MTKYICNKSGFTIIELLITVSILVVITTFAIIGFKNFASFQQYNQAVGDIQFSLEQTRLSARSTEQDSRHGIKFNSDSIVIFVGDVYSAADPQNQIINYELVTLQTTLAGGVDEVVFDKLTGFPSATGTIVVSGVNFSASTTIKLTSTGVIQ